MHASKMHACKVPVRLRLSHRQEFAVHATLARLSRPQEIEATAKRGHRKVRLKGSQLHRKATARQQESEAFDYTNRYLNTHNLFLLLTPEGLPPLPQCCSSTTPLAPPFCSLSSPSPASLLPEIGFFTVIWTRNATTITCPRCLIIPILGQRRAPFRRASQTAVIVGASRSMAGV